MQCWLPEKVNEATGFTIRIVTLTKTSSLGEMRGLQNSRGSQTRKLTPFVLPHNASISSSNLAKMNGRSRTAQYCFLLPCDLSHLSILACGDSHSVIQGAEPWFLGSSMLFNRLFLITLTLAFMKGNTLHSSPYIIFLSHYHP